MKRMYNYVTLAFLVVVSGAVLFGKDFKVEASLENGLALLAGVGLGVLIGLVGWWLDGTIEGGKK